jgi:tRNA(Ile)-lysidine synthase
LLRRGTGAPSPLSDQAIEAIFAPLAEAEALLLAVSGGPDSTALLLMAASWARRRGGRPRLEAATVDHGLRAESADEARAVGELCHKLGVPHHILEWRGAKPKSRVQERAREARYALLGECADAIGADVVVTAHHLDDQAETALFRLLRGSGIGGLRAMEARTAREGVTIARPLLGLAKRALIAHCEAEGVAFAHDPSNDDPRYARTRLRALSGALAAEGLDAPALARLARRAGQVEDALARQTEAAESRLRLVETAACDARALFAEPIEIVQRLLTAAIAKAGGRQASRVGLEKIETLAQALQRALAAGDAFGANVAGARVRLRAKGALRIEPEPPRRASARRQPAVNSGAAAPDEDRRAFRQSPRRRATAARRRSVRAPDRSA